MVDTNTPETLYREQHMQVLLHLLTAHADTVRHHIRGTAHNPTLGAAAESGVREVLRRHLPTTLAVTSGFIRTTEGALLQPGDKGDLSHQTDVIVYDATRACPYYRFDGIEIVPAEDVLAVIEVKDTSADEGVLSGKDGALNHIAHLAKFVPSAFRGIVLLQGGEPKKAREELGNARLSTDSAPHAIYCGAYDHTKEGYLAAMDEISGEIVIHAYGKDRGSPLVGFLRMVVGHMAAQGLMSSALLPGLIPYAAKGTTVEPLRLTESAFPSLYEAIRPYEESPRPSIHKRFQKFVEKKCNAKNGDAKVLPPIVSVMASPGRDSDGRPTVGTLLRIDYEKDDDDGGAVASFFHVHRRVAVAECLGARPEDPWQIADERMVDYLRRALSSIPDVNILINRDHLASGR